MQLKKRPTTVWIHPIIILRRSGAFTARPPATPELQARYDLLMSDAFITLASHLRYGKVDPGSLDPNWNLSNTVSRSALEYRLQNALAAGRIAAVLQELRPQHPEYDRLRKGLARYRIIAREGGWRSLNEGATFKRGAGYPCSSAAPASESFR